MPISSLILRTQSEQKASLLKTLQAMDTTIEAFEQENAIVVISETPAIEADQALWEHIQQLPGVLHQDLVFHHFEDTLEPEGDISHAHQT